MYFVPIQTEICLVRNVESIAPVAYRGAFLFNKLTKPDSERNTATVRRSAKGDPALRTPAPGRARVPGEGAVGFIGRPV